MIRALFFMLIASLSAPLAAQPSGSGADAPYAYRQLDNQAAEESAQALMETIRCIQCQGQSIADSDAPIAGAMRHEIRTRIARGQSVDGIREYLISRYGEWVSFQPRPRPLTWPLWAVPLAVLMLGGWLAWRRFRRAPQTEGEQA